MITKNLLTTIAFAFVLLFSGCAEDDFNEIDGVCPLVVSTVPEDGAIDVPLNQVITVTFNEKMNPSTISETSFTVGNGDTLINGNVTYTDSTAVFTPSSLLDFDTEYTGTINTLVKDLRGNALQEDYTWTFTTVLPLEEFLIEVSSNPAIGGVTSGGGQFDDGSIVTLTATPNTGYTFVNWTASGVEVSTNSNYTFTVTTNTTLVANYSLIPPTQFGINLSSSPIEGGSTNGSGSFDTGTSVSVTATANTGYTFVNWTASGIEVSTDSNYTFVLNANTTLVANFVINTYTLQVTSVNGTVAVNPIQTTYNHGATVVLTPTPATGYEFASWSGDATGTNNPLTITMNGDKNITANFSLIVTTFTLNITAQNGSVSKNPNQSTYNDGDNVILTPTPDSGYEFTSWSGDVTGNDNPLTVIMNANKNITANFSLIGTTFTLNVTAQNGSVNKNPDQSTYNDGDNVILTPTPDSGYEFTSWSGDATGNDNPLNVLMNANKNITANFTLVTIGSYPAGVDLGSAGAFAILGGSGVTNTGTSTVITGDVGSFPTATINGLLPSNVIGTLFTSADPIVGLAKDALTAAYNDAQSRSINAISLPGQLGGLTLAPGLYVNSSTSGISGTGANGILTLDAGGDANAVWIFKMGSTLITDAGTSIVLAGGAKASNIYWSIGTSATLGTNSIFYGNILADQSITLATGAVLYGRALTRIAAVTLDSNTVTKP